MQSSLTVASPLSLGIGGFLRLCSSSLETCLLQAAEAETRLVLISPLVQHYPPAAAAAAVHYLTLGSLRNIFKAYRTDC